MITLLSSDSERVIADKDVVQRSIFIRDMIESLGEPDEPIPLPNVSSSILRKVLEYCEHHRGEPLPAADTGSKRAGIFMNISQWDWEFVNVDPDMLLEMILAANYLHIDPLLDLGCKRFARMIMGKKPEELCKMFDIPDEWTPQEV